MPRLMNADDTMQTLNTGGMQAFQFSGKRIEHLGATEYTLATVAIDVTGSTLGFEKGLKQALLSSVDACKKSPRANNLMLRVILFSSSCAPGGIEEVHGFKPLGEIDPSDYPDIHPSGMTNLFDATYSAVSATNTYAKQLMDQEFSVNGIVIVITDGIDNVSRCTPDMVKSAIEDAKKAETIESLIGVVVGVNAAACFTELNNFSDGSGMKYIDAGEATRGKLAKLGEFVSQSISSQSQSLGTGGPSQNIAATI